MAKQAKQYVSVNAMSTEHRAIVKKAVESLSDSYTRIAGERDLIKEVLDDTSDTTNVDKKILKKLARTYFKASFNKESEEYTTFEEMYEILFNSKE